MHKIAIYWKWWIWKSTISSNLSASLSIIWKKVLHIWCDPKKDSTKKLLWWKKIESVMEILQKKNNIDEINELIVKWFNWIDCIEAGWPIPGTWCAGRWISRMFEIFDDIDLLDEMYDVLIFDVLWDVVCWWFASPLRLWYWEKVFIVISEEIMSMYACNNICKAINVYSSNNVYAWWVIVNMRHNDYDKKIIEDFVKKIWLKIVEFIPRDKNITNAEYDSKTILELDKDLETSKLFISLSEKLLHINKKNIKYKDPTPLDEEQFEEFFKSYSKKYDK